MRVEVLCRSWAYPHIKPPSVSLAIWSNLGETIVRVDREEVDSLLHLYGVLHTWRSNLGYPQSSHIERPEKLRSIHLFCLGRIWGHWTWG